MRRTQPTYSSETGCLKSPMSAPNIRYNRRSYRASDRRRQSCVGIYYLPIGIRSPMMSCILQIPSQHTDPMVIISESILLSIVYYQSIGNIPSRFCPMTEYSLDDSEYCIRSHLDTQPYKPLYSTSECLDSLGICDPDTVPCNLDTRDSLMGGESHSLEYRVFPRLSLG